MTPMNPMIPIPAAAVPSPCTSVCRMHAATGWCEGCLRTLDEIARWGSLPEAQRQQVLDGLVPRRVHWQALVAAGTAPALPQPRSQRRRQP